MLLFVYTTCLIQVLADGTKNTHGVAMNDHGALIQRPVFKAENCFFSKPMRIYQAMAKSTPYCLVPIGLINIGQCLVCSIKGWYQYFSRYTGNSHTVIISSLYPNAAGKAWFGGRLRAPKITKSILLLIINLSSFDYVRPALLLGIQLTGFARHVSISDQRCSLTVLSAQSITQHITHRKRQYSTHCVSQCHRSDKADITERTSQSLNTAGPPAASAGKT